MQSLEDTFELMPGFRFHPTDEELVEHFLKRKVAGLKSAIELISEINFYNFDPWELPARAQIGEIEWFFYSCDTTSSNGLSKNHKTPSGYWLDTGEVRKIGRSSGYKNTLVFYGGKPPRGVQTNWVMHEYRLCGDGSQGSLSFQGAFTLCRLFQSEDPILQASRIHGEPKDKRVRSNSSNCGDFASSAGMSSEPVIDSDNTNFPTGHLAGNGNNVSSPVKYHPYQTTPVMENGTISMGINVSSQCRVGYFDWIGDPDSPKLVRAANNGSNVVSAEQSNVDVTRILAGTEPLRNGDQMMQLDLSDQQSLDGANNESDFVGAEQSNIDFIRFFQLDLTGQQLVDGAKNESNFVGAEQSNIDVTRFSPGLEHLVNVDPMVQLDLWDQQSLDGTNNGSNVVGAEQSSIDVARFLQLDLSGQQLVDGAKNERNVVGAEQSNIDVSRFLPGLEHLQNGGLDLRIQQLVDGANHGNNVVGAEQSNVDVTHLRKKGTIKEPKKGEKTTRPRIEISLQQIEQCSELTLDVAANKLEVCRSTLQRRARVFGITCWRPDEIKKACRDWASKSLPFVDQTQQLINSDQPLATGAAQTRPRDMVIMPQDNNNNSSNKVTIKAKYEKINSMFQLSQPPRVEDLQQEVAKRFPILKAGTYDIQYKDKKDGDMISILCNDDLQGYIATSASEGATSVVIFLTKTI